jgi:hypothetical protein
LQPDKAMSAAAWRRIERLHNCIFYPRENLRTRIGSSSKASTYSRGTRAAFNTVTLSGLRYCRVFAALIEPWRFPHIEALNVQSNGFFRGEPA